MDLGDILAGLVSKSELRLARLLFQQNACKDPFVWALAKVEPPTSVIHVGIQEHTSHLPRMLSITASCNVLLKGLQPWQPN